MKEQVIDEILKEIDKCFLLCKSKSEFKNNIKNLLQCILSEKEQIETKSYSSPEEDEL